MQSESVYPHVGFTVSRHARERLSERFPGKELLIEDLCRGFYRKHEAFLRNTTYKYRRGNLVGVLRGGRLITVYPAKQHRTFDA